MQVEDRSRAQAVGSTWGRSTLASLTMHGLLVSIGFAVPFVWTGTRAPSVNATVWARVEPSELEPLEEPPEPELEVVESELPFEDPTVATLPVDPEPFPELDPPAPLDPIDWSSTGFRRAPMEAIFRTQAEVSEPAPAEIIPVAADTPIEKPDPEPQPVEVEATALANHCPPPVYPRRAQRMGWYGTVVCSMVVGEDGAVRTVLLLQSSGHGLLDETVLRTLQDWRFAPATRDGIPTETRVIRRFRFELPS